MFQKQLQDISVQTKLNSWDEDFSNVFVYKSNKVLEYFIEKKSNYHLESTYNWKKQKPL